MAGSGAELEVDAAAVYDFLEELFEAYDRVDVPRRTYVLVVLLPSLVFFLGTVAGAFALPLPPLIRLPIPVLGILVFGAALGYPKLYLDSRRAAIENQLHLLLTHMTVLSTTNIDRMEVFRTLAAEEEYGVSAEEVAKVVHLVDTWNQSLDDACRRRAKQVPSDALSDFFDRLGYTLGAGQELSTFLLSEQQVMFQNYVTVYEGTLDNLEVMKDLYLSMILSMTFAVVFAVVLPILTRTDPTMTVASVIVLFVLVQLGFYVAIRAMTPHDPVWFHPPDGRAPFDRWLQASVVVGVGGTLALEALVAAGIAGYGPGIEGLLFFLGDVPLPLYVCIPVSPMLIPGAVMRRAEADIAARDEEFPSFIRALGATESAKQSTTSKVLETLREKDFGALSPAIERLYRRLKIRIDPSEAWEAFAVDTRSYLIQKFSDMYLEGRRMGGEPKLLGELISENMSTVMQLREQRRQATITLIGLLYGITAASSFAFFIGLQVVAILTSLSDTLNAASGNPVFEKVIYAGAYDIPFIRYLLLLVILFNAVLSSLMIRTIDGGNKANTYIHFVSLTWLGCLTSIVTQALVSTVLTI